MTSGIDEQCNSITHTKFSWEGGGFVSYMNLTGELYYIIIYQSEGENPGNVCIQRGMTFVHALQTSNWSVE